MRVSVFPAGSRLSPFVRQFTVVETDAAATRSLLPERGLVLGIRYRGSASLVNGTTVTRLGYSSLSGMVDSARQMRTAPNSGIVVAAFHPAGAARFFAEPLHELFDHAVALDNLMPRAAVQRVQDQLADARDAAARVAIVEQFLWARLRPGAPDLVAEAAVTAIQRAHGAIRIAALARQLGISQDPLEKRFRQVIGTSPKHLASLVRLQHVLDRVNARARALSLLRPNQGELAAQPRQLPWSRLAIEAGYFDQSHFIREFRAVTGAPPSTFFRTADYC